MAIKIADIKKNENNPRLIKDAKFEKLKRNIEKYPKFLEVRPIVIESYENPVILGGNMRYEALKALGYKELKNEWVRVIDDLTEDERKAFIILDNVGFGEWDDDILANEWNVDELNEWGLEISFNTEEEVIEDDFEIADEIKTSIVLGDIIEIGEHRLMCGDATNFEHLDKLLQNEKAGFIFTDPPYDLENEDYCESIFAYSKDAHVFVMHDDKGIVNYLRRSQLEFSRFYVANFGFSSPRGNDPYLSHILISQEKNGNAIPHQNLYDGFRSIIPMEYRFRLKDDKTEHKHQKPIEFVATFIKHFSNENHSVLDLFGGSGSTMVASQQLKRKCFMMELDPKNCQIILDRMIKLDSSLEVKINGVAYGL